MRYEQVLWTKVGKLVLTLESTDVWTHSVLTDLMERLSPHFSKCADEIRWMIDHAFDQGEVSKG
jgi:Uri superfamily endonuclease